jgi:hypothetical protein
MNCKLCNKPVIDHQRQLCRQHHREAKMAEWMDNTDINNLGIVKWVHELLPEFATQATPWFHKELFVDLFNLYNPEYRNKYERLYEFISFRESAKSTAANTLFLAYLIANNGNSIRLTIDGTIKEFKLQEKTICIISETSTSAEEFTSRIRDSFFTNERLRYYYDFQIQDAIDDITGQLTRKSFKINNVWVQGVGSGQQIRGKVKGPSRPTLVIADDIYSEKNTITETGRANVKRWWNAAVMNSVDNVLGKVVMLGTIVHDDTVLVEAKRNPQWTTKEIAMMNIDKFEEFIKDYTEVDWDTAQCKLPFEEIEDRNARLRAQRKYFDDVQKQQDWGLSWPERIDLYFVAIKYKEAVFNQTVSVFYQEYFHITTSPEDRRFKKEFFQHSTYELKWEHGTNWILTDGKWQNCNIEFGVDLAGTGPDDAVITVIAVLPDNKIYILHQAIGKFSLRDDLYGETADHLRYNKVCMDRSAIKKIGIIDEVFRLSRRYHPIKVKVGVAGEEDSVRILMERVFQNNRDYMTYIMKRPQTSREGQKEIRIANTMLPYYETRMVYHCGNLSKLEYQLEFLGKTNHDDAADSAECAFFSIEVPEPLEYSSLNDKYFENENVTQPNYRTGDAKIFNITNNWREY